jgi:hypothetical protein
VNKRRIEAHTIACSNRFFVFSRFLASVFNATCKMQKDDGDVSGAMVGGREGVAREVEARIEVLNEI